MVKSKTNIHGQISFSQLQRMLSDLEAPTTVVDAQRDNVLDNVPSNNELSESRKERQPRVRLFFSCAPCGARR